MYLETFGLREPPFSITPDPRFVFLSDRHRDALAHLLFGIGQGGSGGFVQLTGEVGTGKTTLSRLLLEQLTEDTRVALVLNPKLSPAELIETICEELRIDIDGRRGNSKALIDALNAYLLEAYAQGLRVVLIIDEAQNLSSEALEQVRLLTNLETPTQKLLQIILLGQPELRDMLARDDLRQLAQRITARYHLTPLDASETEAYLRHRLAVAGSQRLPFSKLGVRALHARASGIPRLLNIIADRALMAAYARDEDAIGERLVNTAADEVLAPGTRGRWLRRAPIGWAALGIALVIALILVAGPMRRMLSHPADVADAGQTEAAERPVGAALTKALSRGELTAAIVAAENTRFHAWTTLLALWTLRADQADVASAMRCPDEIAAGIHCLRGAGTLTKLDAIRRPVILHLVDAGHEAFAVLLGIGPSEVRINLGGELIQIDRRDFDDVWFGQFYALWRAPEFVDGILRRGDSGAGVSWLHERLAARGLLQAGADGPVVYDELTEQAVRRLQTAHGLNPDGVVGAETLLALTSDERAGPRLRRNLR